MPASHSGPETSGASVSHTKMISFSSTRIRLLLALIIGIVLWQIFLNWPTETNEPQLHTVSFGIKKGSS